MMQKTTTPPGPPFDWDAWYEGIGGRTIDIAEIDQMIGEIYNDQIPRFDGPVADRTG